MFINTFNNLLNIKKSKDILPDAIPIPLNSELDIWLNNNVVYKWWIDSLHIPIHSLMPNPISLKYDDFLKKILIYSNFYQISIKDDGIRYGMYFCKDHKHDNLSFMMNRIGEKFIIKCQTNEDIYNGTVFDGEWIAEQNNSANKQFKIFDIVAIYGHYIVQNCSLYDRLHVIQHILTHFPIVYLSDNYNVELIVKSWLKVEQIKKLQHYFINDCANDNDKNDDDDNDDNNTNNCDDPYFWIQNNTKYDGLIFMPTLLPVGRGMQQNIYKWKQHHTIDLRLVVYKLETTNNNNHTNKLIVEFLTNIKNNNCNEYNNNNNFEEAIVKDYRDDENNIYWSIYFKPLVLSSSSLSNNDCYSNYCEKKSSKKRLKNLAQISTNEFLNKTFYKDTKSSTIIKLILNYNEKQPIFEKIYKHILTEHSNLLDQQKKEYNPDQPSYVLDTSLEKMFVTWSQINLENRLILNKNYASGGDVQQEDNDFDDKNSSNLDNDNNNNNNNNNKKVTKCIDLIVECKFKRSKNNHNIYHFTLEKIRTDKFTPNPDYIIRETLKNQYENISFEQMKNCIESIPNIEMHNKSF